MWTGGKDSKLTLYFAREVADQFGYELPPAIFIDHYQHFDELHKFVEHRAGCAQDKEVLLERLPDLGYL